MKTANCVAPHKKLIVWQKAFNLAKEVYKLTENFPKSEKFGLTQQICRAAISVVSNIAEGASRVSGKEKIQFFIISRGSLVELETQLLLVKELNYFSDEKIFHEIENVGKLLNGLIQSRRKALKFLTLLILTITYLLSPTTYAAFLDHGWSTRAEGMAGSFTSISNDSTAIFYNPSGLAQIYTKELNLMYTKALLGLEGVDISFMQGSFSYPTYKYGNFGIGITHYNVNGLYFENTIIIGYGYDTQLLFKDIPQTLIGANLKYLIWRVIWDEEIKKLNDSTVQAGDSKSNFSIDIGVMSEPIENLKIGLVCKNLNSPDIGIRYENKIPQEIKFGISYNIGDVFRFEDLTPAIEVSHQFQDYAETQKLNYSFGFETWFNFHTFGLRTGFNKTDLSLGLSYHPQIKENLKLKIDYAILFSTVYKDSLGSHKISFGIEF